MDFSEIIKSAVENKNKKDKESGVDARFTRNQRVAMITKTLIENPNKVINLNTFTEMFSAAKSTISEDVVIVRESLNKLDMGTIQTVAGAAGGIKYICDMSEHQQLEFAKELCKEIKKEERIILNNFLYLTDILANPYILKMAGKILAAQYVRESVDYVVTVETKGIPLAYEVANMLGVPLVIVRKDTKLTEGTTVSINYMSGSSNKIQTMSLSKRSMKKESRCVMVDDFMKGGGTANGIKHLLHEFDSELIGIGVLIDDINLKNKLTDDYVSILEYAGISEEGIAEIQPSKRFVEQ